MPVVTNVGKADLALASGVSGVLKGVSGALTPAVANTDYATPEFVTAGLALKADAATVTAALALKANLASPALTGTPTAPTATVGTSTTQLATTAFVATGLALKADAAATTAALALKAPLASPIFTGSTTVTGAIGPVLAVYSYTGAEATGNAYLGAQYDGPSGTIGYLVVTAPSYAASGLFTANGLFLQNVATGGNLGVYTRGNGDIIFATGGNSPTERLRISNTGITASAPIVATNLTSTNITGTLATLGGIAIGPDYAVNPTLRGLIDVTSATYPKCLISFRNAASGAWGITLGAETVANVYIGVAGDVNDVNSGDNWFWRANWGVSGRAGNTFQAASRRASAAITPVAIRGDLSQTAPILALQGISSTNAARDQALIDTAWVDSTDASRKGRLKLLACDWTGTNREGFRIDSDGTQAKISFFAGATAAKPTVSGSRGGNAALASVITALAGFNLLTDSSTV